MFDFVLYALVGISWVLTLAFTVLLGLLCIRIRSKGLIIITAVLVFPPTLGLIPSYVIRLYIDQWAIGELNNWFTQHMTIEGTPRWFVGIGCFPNLSRMEWREDSLEPA